MNNHQHQQQDIHHIFVQNENDELDVNNDDTFGRFSHATHFKNKLLNTFF